MVDELLRLMGECSNDIGNAALGIRGTNTRPIGRVNDAKPLTEYNADHPYMISMYDLDPDY